MLVFLCSTRFTRIVSRNDSVLLYFACACVCAKCMHTTPFIFLYANAALLLLSLFSSVQTHFTRTFCICTYASMIKIKRIGLFSSLLASRSLFFFCGQITQWKTVSFIQCFHRVAMGFNTLTFFLDNKIDCLGRFFLHFYSSFSCRSFSRFCGRSAF